MKLSFLNVTLMACLVAPLPVLPQDSEPHARPLLDGEWVEVIHAELPLARVTPYGEKGGGMGASAYGVRIGRYQGTILETRLDIGVIALFFGWDISSEKCEQAKQDLRVVWVEKGGAEHVVLFGGGSCQAMLFTSPSGVPTPNLAAWTVQRKASAAWAAESGDLRVAEPPSSTGARLSAAAVLKVADEFAKEKTDPFEPFDLKWYPKRSATYDPKSGKWRVHYTRIPPRTTGDHFTVEVDDKSGEKWFIGGA